MKKQYSKFLRILITSILYIGYFSISSSLAQISEGGLPPSFQFAGSLRSEKLAEQVPVNFSVEDLKAVDAWRVSQGAPLRVAKSIPTSFDIADSGDWISLPDGSQIWQLHLQAKGAIALILYYSDFYIPKGARLYLYNAAKTQVLGAYTHRTHPENGPFATQAVAGDEVILEYVPAPSGETPRLRIREVGYGYNHLEAIMPEVQEAPGAGFSEACEVNINCEEGADWQEQKKGVIQMIQYIRNKEGEGGSYICTASLVNNTARDKKPYVLSAFHCSQDMLGEQTVTPEELAVWLFYFHQEHVGCDNESPIYPIKTMVGCTRKASTPVENGSDGLLLLLNDEIPDDYNVFFNGWDRSNMLSLSGVGIHHPSGDYMKISTYGNYPTESITWRNSDVGKTGATNAHWNATFDATLNGHGVTEGGSSGSPLFNSKGLIIGTLSGGSSSCELPEGLNLYGKLYYHWNKYSDNDTARMDVWLDPLGTGVTSLQGMTQDGKTLGNEYEGPTDLKYKQISTGEIQLTWNAPVLEKIAGWGSQDRYQQFGLGGDPFYFAQKWDTKDLQPVHKKTIRKVNFYPQEGVTYGVYIKQGNREYEESFTQLKSGKINSVTLKTPFVIDAKQDLLVAIHVISYANNTYPACSDEGPAVDGKGNLYSLDGKKWETFSDDELDANVVLSIVISAEEGELPSSSVFSTSTFSEKPQPMRTGRLSFRKLAIASDAQEAELITAFPELTGYKVYQDTRELTTLPVSQRNYTVKNLTTSTPLLQVTALYGTDESAPATVIPETSVGNELKPTGEEVDIQPRIFSNEVQIQNYQQLKSLEIYRADGKLIRSIPQPGSSLSTGDFATGMYIFRLTTEKGSQTVQGIKK